MAKYRTHLPQLDHTPFITDGGLETTLTFINELDLPEFAAFPLLDHGAKEQLISDYYLPYIKVAKQKKTGFILESPTWRASSSWGSKLGYGEKALREVNEHAIELMAQLRDRFEDENSPMVISGNLGPRGDGYLVQEKMTVEEAYRYHRTQIETFAGTEADLVSAFTLNYVEEAIGITLAAQEFALPVVIAFTVETDGRLPSGQPLKRAIEEVDEATANGPVYYMINCAHPSHFSQVFNNEGEWLSRIHAIRANASRKSHAELDESTELDRGNPIELAEQYKELQDLLPELNVVGGCCGTDHHHIAAICETWSATDQHQQ